MESREKRKSYLESIKELESEFGEDKLAFDVACILAETTDDGETVKLLDIPEYLDPPQTYGISDLYYFEIAIKKAIHSLKIYFKNHDYRSKRTKLDLKHSSITWGYSLKHKDPKKTSGPAYYERTSLTATVLAETRKKLALLC